MVVRLGGENMVVGRCIAFEKNNRCIVFEQNDMCITFEKNDR